ncbi:hypothetical protein [Mucilaginibacter agri]|uniref:Uncharacterized protein n=1 Tax=Mucilaginibacter agri TaxID=2695265 RepID=A0A965ZCW6_9SPHI|nr:hypothetical protein [Mucilaginibacter agri]NCD68703.1 hypothetical protein [Mucilaginibacter agri]
MSELKIKAPLPVPSFSIAACDIKRSSATLGGSQYTSTAPKSRLDVSFNNTAKKLGSDSLRRDKVKL